MTEKEFSAIVKENSERLYWHIRRMVYDHEDANDILQNTFLKAWNSMDDFQNKSKVSTWLYRIAVNESLDFIRKRKHDLEGMSVDELKSLGNQLRADAYFDGDETQIRLQQAIATLPPVQKMVFNMRYFEDMKYSEISKVLDTSEGALKASYHIAVEKISEFLKNID